MISGGVINRSPNEIIADHERLQKEARLRRLKAVRSASAKFQHERSAAFQRGVHEERAVMERQAHAEMARVTLNDITMLEDQLRLCLTQMGVAHENARTFNVDMTESMLRENEAFKAHILMSNMRFEVAMDLIKAFRYEQKILKAAPVENRHDSFIRAKDLLERISAINERARQKSASMPLCHPFDSLHRSAAVAPVDYRVTRVHAGATQQNAIDLARIEEQRRASRLEEEQMMKQQRQRKSMSRGLIAEKQVEAVRISRAMRGPLRQAVVDDRTQKLRLASVRGLADKKKYLRDRLKNEFEAAFPALKDFNREEEVRLVRSEADARMRRSRARPRIRSVVKLSLSPDDLTDRLSLPFDNNAAIIPTCFVQSILQDDAVVDETAEIEVVSQSLDRIRHETAPPPKLPSVRFDIPVASSPVRFDMPVASSPHLLKDQVVASASEAYSPPTSGRLEPQVAPSSKEVSEHFTPLSTASLSHLAPPVTTPDRLPMDTPEATHVHLSSPSTPESGVKDEDLIARELSHSSSTASLEDSVSLSSHHQSHEPQSVDFEELNNQDAARALALANLDFSAEDLNELDRRAEDLLRSNIPTTPQLLAMRSEGSVVDFQLNQESGDDLSANQLSALLGVDTDELSSQFKQTLDDTLAFLHTSRAELDRMKSSDQLREPVSGNLSEDEKHDDVSLQAMTMADALLLPQEVDDDSSEMTVTQPSSSSGSLREQFMANKSLVARIERRRAEREAASQRRRRRSSDS